jgi:hypothetical protein
MNANENIGFLNKFTSEYDLTLISANKALYLENNIKFGGRVANFIIDDLDIKHYNDVLNIIFPERVTVNGIDDLLYHITKIVEWIQLRLNTRFLFKSKDWNYFNKEYVRKCFNKEGFNDLKALQLIDTNIRNLFFGDCREHEVLLHVLTKLFLMRNGLLAKYSVRRIYIKGYTIRHKEQYETRNVPMKETIFQYVPKYERMQRSTMRGGYYMPDETAHWEHTHPVLYDIENDRLYSIDAVRHKTKWNPKCDVTHNIELEVTNFTPNADCIPYVNYKGMEDGDHRVYIGFPTSFSGNAPSVVDKKESVLFSHKFVLDVPKLSGNNQYSTYGKYLLIDVGDMLSDTNRPLESLFDRTIDLLCLKKDPSPALKRVNTIHIARGISAQSAPGSKASNGSKPRSPKASTPTAARSSNSAKTASKRKSRRSTAALARAASLAASFQPNSQ